MPVFVARRPSTRATSIDFAAINAIALPQIEILCRRWLPGGKRIGQEWVCGSLRGEAGSSCRINLRSGKWADFAAGDKGGDPVSLAAAVTGLTQVEAARSLATMFGLDEMGGDH